ncbi:MAG TPA: alcohol dehydrogenase catalytic domain-containing protein [Candidatus Angelobacter sp.]|nr:alcohol dehydrogenase catalytic domain-containing protein [Candidatus Angelobacter sp.]
MRAVRLHVPGEPLRLEDLPLPAPVDDQVRVRVGGCGVCRTDLHLLDGTQTRVTLPRILGHEVAGWIDAVGPDAAEEMRARRLRVGDSVVVFGGWGCGVCRECLAGAEQRCASSIAPGFQADGGYAEAILVPHARHLEPLGRLDPVRAAPLADAAMTAHRAVQRTAPWLRPGARVLVIGCGGVGAFAVQLLRIAPNGDDLAIGVRELDPGRLERAAELGADIGLLAAEPSMVLDAFGGPVDVVIDVVGTDGTLRHAADVVAPDGLVLLVGEAGGRIGFGFDDMPLESWLSSVAWGDRRDLSAGTALARAGRLRWEVEPVPLEDAGQALDRMRAGEVEGRLVLVP